MKLSKYATEIVIDDMKSMLYSTLSRRYFVYEKKKETIIKQFINEINKGVYTEEEIAVFKELYNKEIIIQDATAEEAKLEVLEQAARYQDSVYKLMIYATNACNFRCTYCEQPHIAKRLSKETQRRILSLIDRKTKISKVMEIDWFGGEPMLEYDTVCDMLDKASEICSKNNCQLVATFTTNGYLLDEEKVKNLKTLNTKSMQITLDGNRECHDKRRVLIDGSKTFDVVLKNILVAVKEGIFITLRINIDHENFKDISEILDQIPREYRSNIAVSINNIFQNKEKISAFDLYKQVIEKGYVYPNRWNTYTVCHACLLNAAVIDTDGTVLMCSNALEEEGLGSLDETGSIRIGRKDEFNKLKSITARNNPECEKCIELPYCIGSCKYARMGNNTSCIGNSGDGLTLCERALLDYYYDLQVKIRRNGNGQSQKDRI